MQYFSPLEYIKLDIANQFGLDKKQFEDRLDWVNTNEHQLESFENQASDKYRYIAAVMAYREVQAGKPTGHRVGFDACSSGPQIMSALLRDLTGAENTSLIGSKRNDLYQVVTETIKEYLPIDYPIEYTRKDIKGVLMPFYYGSIMKPIELFGDNTIEHAAFMKVQAMVCPGAAYLLPILKNSWNAYANEHSWVLPDGFVARVKVTQIKETIIEVDELDHLKFTHQYLINEGTEEGVANIANPIQSIDAFIVREMTRRCNYDRIQFQRVLALLKKRASKKHSNADEVNSIQKIWIDQKITSLVDLEGLKWKDISTFNSDYCNQLIALVERCLNRPSFPVITVHKNHCGCKTY